MPPGQTSIDIGKFVIKSVEDQENFQKTGTIAIAGIRDFVLFYRIERPCLLETRASSQKINKFDVSKIKLWNSDDVNLPPFDESTHCEIGKWAIFKVNFYSKATLTNNSKLCYSFQETNDNSEVFFVLELQVIPEEYYNPATSDYRLRFRYEKQTLVGEKQQTNKKVLIQYALSNDPSEQQQLFAFYYNRVATMPRITRIREMLPDKLGSKLLLRVSKSVLKIDFVFPFH